MKVQLNTVIPMLLGFSCNYSIILHLLGLAPCLTASIWCSQDNVHLRHPFTLSTDREKIRIQLKQCSAWQR